MSEQQRWNHTPNLPITVNPLFERPFSASAVARWYIGAWLPVTINLCIVGLAALCWWLFSPTLDQAARPGWWMLTILARNAVVLTLLAGSLHWVFHGARLQGGAHKYDPRPFPRQGGAFTTGDQLRDNVIWSLCSGVPIWSAYEILIWWAMANGFAPTTSFAETPVWFVVIFLLIPIWESFYFYWIHRLLHTGPFYRFHALHHRNTDVGPWSGMSMHPVEHLFFFGTALIHFAVPSHPVHLVTHLMFYALFAVTTHTGYEGLWIGGAKRVQLGTFHHQLHHRYFRCNFGSLEIPFDRLFGTFHDGVRAPDDGKKQGQKKRSQP